MSEMSQAARDAIAEATVDHDPVVTPERWYRDVTVTYQLADNTIWRPAREGEKCRAGAGGHSEWKRSSCGRDAVVTRVTVKNDKPYPRSWCELHSGGRLPLEDGRVIEPVSNPLGGA